MTEKLCNLCGLTCLLEHPPMDKPSGLIDAVVVGGYESTPGNGSGTLDDMTGYSFSLCEYCLDWLFGRFKIQVQTFDPIRGLTLRPEESIEQGLERTGGFLVLGPSSVKPPWLPAEVRIARDDWRKLKAEFFAEKAKRDAARNEGSVEATLTNRELHAMKLLAALWAERDRMFDTLTATQERCTALVEENRRLQASLKNRQGN